MKNGKTKGKLSEITVKSTRPIKLKDKFGRDFFKFKLIQFGFIPEEMIIEKIHGENNTIVISAVLTPEELKAEKKRQEAKEKVKGLAKPVKTK